MFLGIARNILRIAKAQLYRNATGIDPYDGVGSDDDKRLQAEQTVEAFYETALRQGEYPKSDGTMGQFNAQTFTIRGKDGVELPGQDAHDLFNQAYFVNIVNALPESPVPAGK